MEVSVPLEVEMFPLYLWKSQRMTSDNDTTRTKAKKMEIQSLKKKKKSQIPMIFVDHFDQPTSSN